MIRPNGRNCCRRWPMGRRPPGASESLWTVCSLGGQASGFGRNQAPKTDRLNQVPFWEFRNRRKSFTPRQLARILWDFAYLSWANTYLLRLVPAPLPFIPRWSIFGVPTDQRSRARNEDGIRRSRSDGSSEVAATLPQLASRLLA